MDTLALIEPHNTLARIIEGVRFFHVVRVFGKFTGWQLKLVGPDGVDIQPFYSDAYYGSMEDSLRQALIGRNLLYRQFGYPHSLLYRYQDLSVRTDSTSSGRFGVYLMQKFDGRRGTVHEVVSAHYRKLDTRVAATKTWSLNHFGSPARAVAHAADWRDEQVKKYNLIAMVANKFLIERRLQPAAEKEAETLIPWLDAQRDEEALFWEFARKDINLTLQAYAI